ncbi:MFS transporter [Microbacterium sp. EST19A]|uniref:MFS transporter n=1 Tax=Microbacterium sp. EST19A TaxID=2862681 RepID=UPI001CBBFB1C|nr:MFS transporter [Microbacterium sp. EST19A]
MSTVADPEATEVPTPYPAAPRSLGMLMASYFGVQLIINTANSGVASFLVPLQLDVLDPAAKVANLGLIGTVGAIIAIIAQPLWGALSDRSRTRFGRRVPWVLGGVAGLAGCMIALALSSNFLAIFIFAAATAAFYSMVSAPLFALLPDRTPVHRRGTFSALGGLGIYIGSIAGLFAASPFAADVPTGYIVFAALILIVGTPLTLLIRRDSRALPVAPRQGLRASIASFWVSPRTHPDFAWAFTSRLVLMAGYWGIVSFLLYQLQDYVGLSREDAAATFPMLSLVLLVGILVAILPAGAISDRTGRRKPIVLGASIMLGISVIPPLVSPTVGGLMVSLALAGLALGAYISVDQALMTLVLPDSGQAGKDLGVLNIAQAGGQALAPALASVVIALWGYPGLWVFAGAMAVIGGFAILPIKSVR